MKYSVKTIYPGYSDAKKRFRTVLRYCYRHPRKALRILLDWDALSNVNGRARASLKTRLRTIEAVAHGVAEAGLPGVLELLARRDSVRAWPVLAIERLTEISVIIPIYNGYEHLVRLLPSLGRNTPTDVDIIFYDDASTDFRVRELLEQFVSDRGSGRVIAADRNRGFVRTVNSAAKLARRHFVILNSDTEVPPGWLERLMAPIVHDVANASATPFSNSATIFSFPHANQDNHLLPGLGCDEIDSAFRRLPDGEWPRLVDLEAPTGVGFCMAINGDIWRTIGEFDEASFGRGYGEENDWCQRAIAAGFRNVVVPDLFVFHNHGGSFGLQEKQRLCREHLHRLVARWPRYEQDVASHVERDPWQSVRSGALCRLVMASSPVVIIDHALKGGADVYSQEIIQSNRSSNRAIVVVRYSRDLKVYIGSYELSGCRVEIAALNFFELLPPESFLAGATVICNELVSWPFPLAALAHIRHLKRLRSVILQVPIHDYFCVCPSPFLLNNGSEFCGIPFDLRDCTACLASNPHAVVPGEISEWRAAWGDFLAAADEVICFSKSSLHLLARAYPQLAGSLVVRPHRPRRQLVPIRIRAGTDGETFGVIGNIGFHKGSSIVIRLCEHMREVAPNSEVVVLGIIQSATTLPDNLHVHGPYEHEELGELIERYKISACLFPSIVPETFSFVAQEIMDLRMPIVCFDLGAPAERVAEYFRGIVIKEKDPGHILSALREAQKL